MRQQHQQFFGALNKHGSSHGVFQCAAAAEGSCRQATYASPAASATIQPHANGPFANVVDPISELVNGLPLFTEVTAFQQLLRGGGRGEMGLDALAARARDLQKSLDQMATGLAVNAHNVTW